jgi:hypothetical protein
MSGAIITIFTLQLKPINITSDENIYCTDKISHKFRLMADEWALIQLI